MKKQIKDKIKDILINAKISIKWTDSETWIKEDISNLYEACEKYHITFKAGKDMPSGCGGGKEIIITCKGGVTVQKKSNIVCLERDVITVIKLYLFYLGDKTKFVTEYGTYNIN